MEILRRRFRNGERAQPLRHSARDALRGSSGDESAAWVDDVLVVISELVQNVNQHTDSDGELVVSIEPGTVTIEVTDADSAIPQSRQTDALSAGGRGLLLVAAVSHRWGYRTRPQGKVVWAQVPVSGTDSPTPGVTVGTLETGKVGNEPVAWHCQAG